MFNLKVICPECRIVNCYPFGSGDLISIGDYINNEEAIFMEKTYVREHKIKCLSCGKEHKILEIVNKGQFVNVLINPSKKEEKLLDEGNLPILEEYVGGYSLEDRKKLLLGNDSEFIPSQVSGDYIMKPKDLIYVLDEMWEAFECYKVIDCLDRIHARIYKVKNKRDVERLLVLRDNYMPSLKKPSWDGEIITTEDCFFKYTIPAGCEIVMDLT
ncbi:hypothetical protein [Thomasclavelia cocleata]|uniref:hypothetical protein n=1 Tax=Thomasclavelia cocleata TaxID=69824 RepID=UPI00256EC758|nr:hypothetical protein [Thomasclavelia cocleata]